MKVQDLFEAAQSLSVIVKKHAEVVGTIEDVFGELSTDVSNLLHSVDETEISAFKPKGQNTQSAAAFDSIVKNAKKTDLYGITLGRLASGPVVVYKDTVYVPTDVIKDLAEGEVVQAKFGKEKKRADREALLAKGTPMTMMQAFGSEEMNILHKVGIKLTEKPSYWEDFEEDGFAAKDNIHELKLKKAEKALGGKFRVYKGTDIYGPVDKPKGPLATMKSGVRPNMFIIEFDDGSKYLVDVTQASTYIRMWQKIV